LTLLHSCGWDGSGDGDSTMPKLAARHLWPWRQSRGEKDRSGLGSPPAWRDVSGRHMQALRPAWAGKCVRRVEPLRRVVAKCGKGGGNPCARCGSGFGWTGNVTAAKARTQRETAVAAV
jgi:hypothetical protein